MFENIILPARINDFLTLFLGLIIEAFPFVLLGIIVSVLVAIYFKDEWLQSFTKLNPFLSHLLISVFGVFMPVCECGNIPVVRRFLQKGFKVSHAVTFLLAAPIVNPVTFYSTWEAFSFDRSVAIIRIVSALLIANLIGFIISLKSKQEDLLQPSFIIECAKDNHDHEHSKTEVALDIFQREFVQVMGMLMIGAFIAALSQTFIPREMIASIGSDLFLSIIAMMVLAFVISICSNVDAFFALSYSGSFTLGSIMTFLVFGPMIDIKILTMLRTTFKAKALLIISVLVALLSILVGLLVTLFK